MINCTEKIVSGVKNKKKLNSRLGFFFLNLKRKEIISGGKDTVQRIIVRQDDKKLGKFVGKWNGETGTNG